MEIEINRNCPNQLVLMLTSLHLHEKSREVYIKARSPPPSLAFMAGQLSTTVKWSIDESMGQKDHKGSCPYFSADPSFVARNIRFFPLRNFRFFY